MTTKKREKNGEEGETMWTMINISERWVVVKVELLTLSRVQQCECHHNIPIDFSEIGICPDAKPASSKKAISSSVEEIIF